MFRILIVEDEPPAAESLKQLMAEADASVRFNIEIASTFEDAKEKLSRVSYDAVFCDLLLLPNGSVINAGKISESGKGVRPFSPGDWNLYVMDRGGIELVRIIRSSVPGIKTSPDVPIVITSYFDSLPGYMRTVRAIRSQANTILLPKFYKNPVYRDYSHDPKIRGLARMCLQHVLARNLYDARDYAYRVRSHLFDKRRSNLEAMMNNPTNRFKDNRLIDKYMVLTYKFKLLIEFDPRGDEGLDWSCALNTDPYKWSTLYESWEEFRNSVLMNDKVPVRLSLIAENAASPKDIDPQIIPLPSFSNPAHPVGGLKANSMKKLLRVRTILAYLAFVAEPPVGVTEHGWTVSAVDLVKGAMANIEELPGLEMDTNADHETECLLRWEGCENPINVTSFIAMRDGDASSGAYIQDIRALLDEDLRSYYGIEKVPFLSEHIVVCPNIGYFFNGDLELDLFEESGQGQRPHVAQSCNLKDQNIFLLPMGEDQLFECMGGGVFGADHVEERLKVVFDRVTRVDSFAEIERAFEAGDLKRGDCVLSAPVNSSGIGWWDTQVHSRDGRIQRLLDNGVRIILVPSSEAGASVGSEVFHRFNGFGVHSIYTANFSSGIPEAKVIDAILCSGPRVKYLSREVHEPALAKVLSNAALGVEKDLNEAYADLIAAGALGDPSSGSASVRWKDGTCIITASQTDKKRLESARLTGITKYSPSWNQALWLGRLSVFSLKVAALQVFPSTQL